MTDSTTTQPVKLGRLITYWTTTVIIAFVMGAGGIADVMRIQPVVEGMKQLGYPEYVCVILGVWKVLGCIAILSPGIPLVKEWAYAGIVFDLTGASASHFAVGDAPIKVIMPLIFTIICFMSWATRFGGRRLVRASIARAD